MRFTAVSHVPKPMRYAHERSPISSQSGRVRRGQRLASNDNLVRGYINGSSVIGSCQRSMEIEAILAGLDRDETAALGPGKAKTWHRIDTITTDLNLVEVARRGPF